VDQNETALRVAGGGPGWRVAGNIFRSQVSVVQVSGAGSGLNLYLVLNTCTRDLMAETWDLIMNQARR
jgi:hypothetical protein